MEWSKRFPRNMVIPEWFMPTSFEQRREQKDKLGGNIPTLRNGYPFILLQLQETAVGHSETSSMAVKLGIFPCQTIMTLYGPLRRWSWGNVEVNSRREDNWKINSNLTLVFTASNIILNHQTSSISFLKQSNTFKIEF